MGFVHPQQHGLLNDLGVEYDGRGNVKTDASMMTSVDGVFAAGDMQRGQSLVVHAIAGGRACARHIDTYLVGHSNLPTVRGYARPMIENVQGGCEVAKRRSPRHNRYERRDRGLLWQRIQPGNPLRRP